MHFPSFHLAFILAGPLNFIRVHNSPYAPNHRFFHRRHQLNAISHYIFFLRSLKSASVLTPYGDQLDSKP
jgi:hypothetical protein